MGESEGAGGRNEGRGMLPPRALLVSLAAQVPALVWSWPLETALAPAALGLAMILAGSVLNVWADILFRRSEVDVCPFGTTPKVVCGGPFRFTRNPMYLGMVLITSGAALLANLPWNLWSAAALAVWLHCRFVLTEEAFLEQRLGMGYLRYAVRTPRWLGLPGGRVAPGEVGVAEPGD